MDARKWAAKEVEEQRGTEAMRRRHVEGGASKEKERAEAARRLGREEVHRVGIRETEFEHVEEGTVKEAGKDKDVTALTGGRSNNNKRSVVLVCEEFEGSRVVEGVEGVRAGQRDRVGSKRREIGKDAVESRRGGGAAEKKSPFGGV